MFSTYKRVFSCWNGDGPSLPGPVVSRGGKQGGVLGRLALAIGEIDPTGPVSSVLKLNTNIGLCK